MLANIDVSKDGKLLVYLFGEVTQHSQVERHVLNVKSRRKLSHVELQWIGFVATQHQSAFVGPGINISVDDPGDRLLRPHPVQGLGSEELMAGRNHRNTATSKIGDSAHPGACRVDHEWRSDFTTVG